MTTLSADSAHLVHPHREPRHVAAVAAARPEASASFAFLACVLLAGVATWALALSMAYAYPITLH
jgi:hypothetical protein